MALPTSPTDGDIYKDLQYDSSTGTWKRIPLPSIGGVYIQRAGMPDPSDRFATTVWSNISSSFAGDFFRHEGLNAATFNGGRQGHAVKTHVHTFANDTFTGDNQRASSGGYRWPLSYPQSSAVSGATTDTTETRPVNQTIRVWRRVS